MRNDYDNPYSIVYFCKANENNYSTFSADPELNKMLKHLLGFHLFLEYNPDQ